MFLNNKDTSVTYELNFDNKTDITLAEIFLRELASIKNVPNCPAIAWHEKKPPINVTAAFPGVYNEKTSNGSITL